MRQVKEERTQDIYVESRRQEDNTNRNGRMSQLGKEDAKGWKGEMMEENMRKER
jgi:hypothetical protein